MPSFLRSFFFFNFLKFLSLPLSAFQSEDSSSNKVFPGQTLNSSEIGNKISQVKKIHKTKKKIEVKCANVRWSVRTLLKKKRKKLCICVCVKESTGI